MGSRKQSFGACTALPEENRFEESCSWSCDLGLIALESASLFVPCFTVLKLYWLSGTVHRWL